MGDREARDFDKVSFARVAQRTEPGTPKAGGQGFESPHGYMDYNKEIELMDGDTIILMGVTDGTTIVTMESDSSGVVGIGQLGTGDIRRLRDALNEILELYPECPYWFSHFRGWCGYDDCKGV